MSRNLKALGLALVAVFAMSAVAASGASAHTFTWSATPTFLTASSISPTQKFTIEGTAEEVNCTEVSVTGELTGTPMEASSVTAFPSYNGCTATRGTTVAAKVETTGCWYKFTGETNAEEHAQVHIECPTGIVGIHIKVTGLNLVCFTIPPQTVTGVHYTNTETGTGHGDIDLKATVHKIKTEKGGACGEGTVNAEYNGEVTVKGHDSEKNPSEIHVS